ncbi:MAG: LytTR family DNA-binding domain-containing protein [Pseudomonadota bacterium]
MRIANDIIRFCVIVLGLGLIFAVLGVYNTGQLPFYQSFVFWATTMAVGAGTSLVVSPFVWGPRFEAIAPAFKIGVAAAIISVPVTITLMLFFSVSRWDLTLFVIQYSYVLVISLIVTTAAYIRDVLTTQKAADADVTDPIKGFLERLPVKYRTADLHAISSEDHYLRIHTSLGDELILMRLADAVRELSAADGLQVHRSWWVAKNGITDEKRVDGRSLLVLPSGVEVPVSRSYRAKAKEAGLIR